MVGDDDSPIIADEELRSADPLTVLRAEFADVDKSARQMRDEMRRDILEPSDEA